MPQYMGVLVLLLVTNIVLIIKLSSDPTNNDKSARATVKQTPRPTQQTTPRPTPQPTPRPTPVPSIRPTLAPVPRPVSARKRSKDATSEYGAGWRSFLFWLTIAGAIAVAFGYFRQNYGDDDRFTAGIALNPLRRQGGTSSGGGYAPL